MISANELKAARFSIILGSILILPGYNGGYADSSVNTGYPPLVSTVSPKIIPDGSIRIAREQFIKHIGTPGVFILSPENRARFRMLKAGKIYGQSIEIISGLSGDEKILTAPFGSLFDGSPVRINDNQARTKQ